LPLYRLDWRDGIWRHVERPMRDTLPIELTPEALREAATKFGERSPEWQAPPPKCEGALTRYLEEATRLADDLDARHRAKPPFYRSSIGDPEIDPLIWFKFVE
jgi:hypothetical protein